MAIAAISVAFHLYGAPPQQTPIQTISVITANYVSFQKDAPVRVVGGTSNLEDFVEQIYVLNVSNRTIVECQIGWVVRRGRIQQGKIAEDQDSPGNAFVGKRFATVLPPMQFAVLGAPVIDLQKVEEVLDEHGSKNGVVSVGMVYTRFEDGVEWAYPLAANRRWETRGDPALERRMTPVLRRLEEEVWKVIHTKRRNTSRENSDLPPSGLLARLWAWIEGAWGRESADDEEICKAWAGGGGGRFQVALAGPHWLAAWLCPAQPCANLKPNIVTYKCR